MIGTFPNVGTGDSRTMARKTRSARARRKSQLVTYHLEKVSWQLLESYSRLIREFIRRRSGVYALYRKEQLYYVGLAKNLTGRIKNHLKDRHHGAWDRFSVYVTVHDHHMKELESLLLRIMAPSGNKQMGRFAASRSLLGELNRKMAEEDAARRARLLGGAVSRQLRRKRSAHGSGSGVFAGLFDRAIQLFAKHRGKRFKARLTRKGDVRFRGRKYPSPSAAGRAALGRNVNGWTFWHFRDPRKGTLKLSALRR
jgi:RAMA domain-containing protein/GIY-YIG catalytic domain-containing protein